MPTTLERVPVAVGGLAGAEKVAGFRGVPSNEGRVRGPQAEGLQPEPSRSFSEWVPEAGFCREHKADGAACKARPIKGTDLCVGHTRKAKAQGLITEG